MLIISYSIHVLENLRFSQFQRFTDEKMIMKSSFRTDNFAQSWFPDVNFCSGMITRRKMAFKTDNGQICLETFSEQKILSGDQS